jgi:hypothetical protein
MKMRLRLRRRHGSALALAACAVALLVPAMAGAIPGQDLRSPDARDGTPVQSAPVTFGDLRSPDARDAGQPVAAAAPDVAPAQPTTVLRTVESGNQTLAIVLSATALGLALAGAGAAFVALYRRPRTRWTAT